MGTIAEIQSEITDEFNILEDWMEKYEYIIELGKDLPMIDDKYKTDDNLIKGCQSRVWLHADEKNGKIILNGEVLKQKNDGKFRFNGKTYEREIEYISNDKSYKILNDGNHYSQDFLSELTVPKNHYFVRA